MSAGYERGTIVKGPDLFADHDYRPYVNPWTVVSIRHAGIQTKEARLVDATTEKIARGAASYLGVW
jgi:hypothetical protein